MLTNRLLKITVGVLLVLLPAFSGCGKDDAEGSASGSASFNVVLGQARFGTHCPYGSFSEPHPTPLTSWDCPLNIRRMELTTNPRPVMLSADCKKMTMSVRTADGSVDSFWEIMPDGSFSTTIDSGPIELKQDRKNGSRCTTFAKADFWGKLNCKDRDRIEIEVDAIWWLGQGERPNDFEGRECELPKGCYLHSEARLRQCP